MRYLTIEHVIELHRLLIHYSRLRLNEEKKE